MKDARRDTRRDARSPKTMVEALKDCTDAVADPMVVVFPTNALMVDMLTCLLRLDAAQRDEAGGWEGP